MIIQSMLPGWKATENHWRKIRSQSDNYFKKYLLIPVNILSKAGKAAKNVSKKNLHKI